MPGSYREDLVGGDSGEDRRIEKLRKEVEALRVQLAEIRIAQLEDQRRMLKGQLAGRHPPVDKDRFLKEVRLRHGIALKALHSLVRDGRVMRTGSGKRGEGYGYRLAGTRNDEECANGDPAPMDAPTETPEPHFGWKA
jgi:hypothetical protein